MAMDLESIPEDLWKIACQREAVIRPLAAASQIGRKEIEEASAALGVQRAYLYRLLAAYRERPQTSTLVPQHRGRPHQLRVLDAKVEAVIQAAITGFYLTRERPRFSDLMRDIEARCHAERVAAPNYRTVHRRLDDFDGRKVTAARHGGKRAREIYGPALPQQRPSEPLGFVEIDHTLVDVMVVEEQTRLPLGRPWLSLAMDVATRMVAGFYLAFEAPSSLSVALVLTHAVLPKQAWLAERQIALPWPVSGLPDQIETDNGEEFHSQAFERGAAEYGIRLTYRPPGAPQVGGHIERLIGTFMHRIHLIPGTTFSNVAEKGGYDSEGRAVMTFKELERWLALEILGVYHQSVHTDLRQPPEQAWKERIATRTTPLRHPPHADRFLLNFLPAEKRLIRRDGIRMFHLHYWDNVLSPLAGRSREPFLIKYDPRNLSRVYWCDPKGDYWTIPYRDLGAPPITLWEHRNALRKLNADGLKSVDEKLIFETIAQQRELIAAARLRTRAARLAQARSSTAEPAASPPAPQEPASVDADSLAPFAVDDWS
ncbi:MAG TPA: Mu transposase C-terminal domain-containing protein [Terracidiphilus sp.]|jgi:putative transposase